MLILSDSDDPALCGTQTLRACWNLRKGMTGRWTDENNWIIAGCSHSRRLDEGCCFGNGRFQPWGGTARSRPDCMWVSEAWLGLSSQRQWLTLGWPSAPCLFTCRGMPSYASPNLSEATRPVTRATCTNIHASVRRRIVLVESGSACAKGTLVWGRPLVFTQPERLLLPFAVTVEVHSFYAC